MFSNYKHVPGPRRAYALLDHTVMIASDSASPASSNDCRSHDTAIHGVVATAHVELRLRYTVGMLVASVYRRCSGSVSFSFTQGL